MINSCDIISGTIVRDKSGVTYLIGSSRNKGGSSRVKIEHSVTRLSDGVVKQIDELTIIETCVIVKE